MSNLTKTAEANLIKALETTADLINAKVPPNEAIAKAASAHAIPPGHINQMVCAYNIGRTNRLQDTGSNLLEKTAEFELADVDKVREILYPSKVKTAAALVNETAVSTEYAIPPTGMLARRAQQEKQAHKIDWSMGPPPPPLPRDPTRQLKVAHSNKVRAKRELDEARRTAAAAFDKMGSTFCELTDYFRSPTSTPLPVVREQAMLLHGGRGVRLLDQLVAVTPGLMKMSHHKNGHMLKQAVTLAADGPAYALISQFLDETEDYVVRCGTFQKLAAQAAGAEVPARRPFAQPSPSVLDDGQEKQALDPFSSMFAKDMVSNIAKDIQPRENSAIAQKGLEQLTDPHHEADLRHIRAEATLHDLILNDPIISGYEPHQTIHAYNQLVDTSPRIADQRLLLQPLLRSHLQRGSLDPFEVDQLLGMERKMQQRDVGIYGEPGGRSSDSVI